NVTAARGNRRCWRGSGNGRVTCRHRRWHARSQRQTRECASPAGVPRLPEALRESGGSSRTAAAVPWCPSGSLAQLGPEVDEHLGGEDVAQHDVDRNAGRESVERLAANTHELTEASRQADRQESEGECPCTKRLQRCDERGLEHLLVIGVAEAVRDECD